MAEASGAASKAGEQVHKNRVHFVKAEIPETEVAGQEPRIGVFVCDCGINIRGTVDVPKVVEYAKTLPNVVHSEEGKYTCSADFQEKIKQRIGELKLNRVVVASCTPRTHEPLFQSTIAEAGLNPYLFEMTNIRDQCSWVHMHEPEKATDKSIDLVRMAVAKARLLAPLKKSKQGVLHSSVVIGGGLAGMTAALDIAAQGFPVHIIEREGELGGNLKNIHNEESGIRPSQYLTALVSRVRGNDKITVHLDTSVTDVRGFVGAFKVKTSKGDEIETGAIVVAVGGQQYKPKEHLYGQDAKVVTQWELAEQMLKGPIPAKSVVMIQCVGSRNKEAPYCSRVCCTEAVKNAIDIKKSSPSTEVCILHKDIRTYGFREDYYKLAGELGVNFVRFDESSEPKVEKRRRRPLRLRSTTSSSASRSSCTPTWSCSAQAYVRTRTTRSWRSS